MSTKKGKKSMSVKLSENSIVEIPAGEIHFFAKDDPITVQYPELYDERQTFAVNESLTADIEADGQLQPIRITSFNEQIYVVFGHQRVKAMRAIRPDYLIKATVMDFDVNNIVYARIAENELRQDSPTSLKVKAIGNLLAMKDSEGKERFTPTDLAKRFGVTLPHMLNWKAVAELLALNIAKLKGLYDQGQIKTTALAALAKASRSEDGKLDKKLATENFEKLVSETPSDGRLTVERVQRERTGRQVEKPKAEELRKLLSYPKVPYGYQLIIHWMLGDNSLDTTVSLMRSNGIDPNDWFIPALEQVAEPVQNPKGAGRKAKVKATPESELLS